MPRLTTPLTDTQIKHTVPKNKKYKLSDGNGLFLQVNPNGSKFWRFNYRFNNKLKEYAIGVYPSTTLSKARKEREKLRQFVANGFDVNELKKQKKIDNTIETNKRINTFYIVSQEWHKSYVTEVSENYHNKLLKALENYLYPFIKDKSINDITRLNIIQILKDLKNKGLQETAKRVLMLLNKIYKYAVTLEYTPHNIIADIDQKIILGKRDKKHYPTFTKEKDIKGLLLAIDEYTGNYSTKMALKILPYIFVRSFNIRHCEWSEINFKTKVWVIPKDKMKTKIEFILPLPNQVIEILKEVQEYTGDSTYVFPGIRAKDKPMSDNTLISALRRMGYTKEELVPHSFRSIFSTIAYENANAINGHQFTSEVIEALLSHKETNKIKEAYNRATYKDSMSELIQWYANYLDKVKLK